MPVTSSSRPLIGISTRLNPTDDTNYLRQTYGRAVFAAGGVPVLVPIIADALYINALVPRLDGVLLPGSNSDIDPYRYGQAPHVNLGEVFPERDEVDQLLLAAAESRHLPVLAICYGMQALNVYRGGTLLQDLPSQVENVIQHNQRGTYTRVAHSIQIKQESILARLAGGTTIRVNSHHHQAVDEIGRDLEPIAWSADGVTEAIINTRPGHFMLGVEWHPEVNWEEDSFSQAIFKMFIAEAAIRG